MQCLHGRQAPSTCLPMKSTQWLAGMGSIASPSGSGDVIAGMQMVDVHVMGNQLPNGRCRIRKPNHYLHFNRTVHLSWAISVGPVACLQPCSHAKLHRSTKGSSTRLRALADRRGSPLAAAEVAFETHADFGLVQWRTRSQGQLRRRMGSNHPPVQA